MSTCPKNVAEKSWSFASRWHKTNVFATPYLIPPLQTRQLDLSREGALLMFSTALNNIRALPAGTRLCPLSTIFAVT